MIGGALLIAVAIEQKFIKGKAFFRTTIFLPSVTALVAYALVFKVLLNGDHGLINYVIELFAEKESTGSMRNGRQDLQSSSQSHGDGLAII